MLVVAPTVIAVDTRAGENWHASRFELPPAIANVTAARLPLVPIPVPVVQ